MAKWGEVNKQWKLVKMGENYLWGKRRKSRQSTKVHQKIRHWELMLATRQPGTRLKMRRYCSLIFPFLLAHVRWIILPAACTERLETGPGPCMNIYTQLGTRAQVPKKHFNLDGDGMTWHLWISYLLTQGSWDYGVPQISDGKLLHSGPNLRWTGFLY